MADDVTMQEPDRLGFEKTLALPLLNYCGIACVGVRGLAESRIRELVDQYGPMGAQKHLNHFHMVQRVSAIEMQRSWAFELLDTFRAKASRLFPDRILIGEIRDDNCDVEVTFWLSAGG